MTYAEAREKLEELSKYYVQNGTVMEATQKAIEALKIVEAAEESEDSE